jgi:hypothetical protein
MEVVMGDEMTAALLLRNMREGRAEFEALLDGLDPERLEWSPSPGEWSIKDLLAHISAWDRFALAWLDADARGEAPDLPLPRMTQQQVDAFNAQVYKAYRERPLAEVLAEFSATYEALYRRASGAPEGDLLQSGRYAWLGDWPLYRFLGANSYWHYGEHLEQLRALRANSG